jgi:hypothetical protein
MLESLCALHPTLLVLAVTLESRVLLCAEKVCLRQLRLPSEHLQNLAGQLPSPDQQPEALAVCGKTTLAC